MKALHILFALWLMAAGKFGQQTDYCLGWKDGWEAGYCYKRELWCAHPPCPICPIRPIDSPNTFQGGYNDGFSNGLEYRESTPQ